MLQRATNGRKSYEVTLYNRDVRVAMKDNVSHLIYDDRWADTQTQDVLACDEVEALTLINMRYPPDKGFVVQNIQEYSGRR